MKVLLLTLLLTSFTIMGTAHGDLHKRILSATESIEKDPNNEKLYFHRGKLYFQHEDFHKGIADLQTALHKGYEGEQLHFFLSKCHYGLKAYDEAELAILSYFSIRPDHVRAHSLYGKILYQQEKFSQSAAEFLFVIENATNPLPENYINAANSWSRLDSEESVDKAIEIINKGLAYHGPLISLQQHLIKVLLDDQRYDQAIALQKSIIRSKDRKEAAYYALFEMASAKGDKCLAREALISAEESWKILPARIKKNSAMSQLRMEIDKNKHSLTSITCK